MAHAAELNQNNLVIRVVVISNDYEPNVEQFATELFGGVWKQTSYNGNIRKNYAGIGYSYWPDLDAFVAPKCHDEAVLDETTARWICNNEEHTTREIN